MKYMLLSAFLLLFYSDTFSKGKEGKTFMVLFNKNELKEIQSSQEYIELNFFNKFPTKSYSGNSEAALLITVPFSDMTECGLGEMLVQVNPSTWVPLQDIAFRIIDLEECKENYHALLSKKEDAPLHSKNPLVKFKI